MSKLRRSAAAFSLIVTLLTGTAQAAPQGDDSSSWRNLLSRVRNAIVKILEEAPARPIFPGG